MILFDVKCAKDHVFEGWFRDSDSFDKQVKAGEIECPVCGDAKLAKAPMAPNLARASDVRRAETAARAMRRLRAVRDHVEKNFDHVGERFPEEARKIHYGEVEQRNIYGDATADEARSLVDEGVEIGVLPSLPRSDA